jgi:hypothetical protein
MRKRLSRANSHSVDWFRRADIPGIRLHTPTELKEHEAKAKTPASVFYSSLPLSWKTVAYRVRQSCLSRFSGSSPHHLQGQSFRTEGSPS